MRRITIYLLLVVALMAGGIWYWAARVPTISRNYAAELNAAALRADPATLAWPEIKRALIRLPDLPESLWKLGHEGTKSWADVKPGEPEWPQVREYVEAIRPSLVAIRSAASRPNLGYLLTDADDKEMWEDDWRRSGKAPEGEPRVATPNPAMIDVNLHFVGKFRYCARLIRADSRLAITTNEPERVVQNIVALFDLSRLAQQGSGLLGQMVSVGIEVVGLQLVAECLEASTAFFSPDQLARLDSLISGGAGKQRLDSALQYERLMFEDALQRSFFDNGAGNGGITYKGLRTWADPDPKPGKANWDRVLLGAVFLGDRQAQLRHYDSVIRSAFGDMNVAPWNYDGPGNTTMSLTKPAGLIAGIRVMPALIYVPSMSKVTVVRWQLEELVAATRCIIALHRFHIDQHCWPASLGDLKPSYLTESPVDRFDGNPLRYRIEADLPLLYSVGTNRFDDGGKPAPGSRFAGEWVSPSRLAADPRFQPGRNSGWDNIFFPPSKTNEPINSGSDE